MMIHNPGQGAVVATWAWGPESAPRYGRFPIDAAVASAAPAQPAVEFQRHRDLRATPLQRFGQQSLGAMDAVEDRVAVGEQRGRGARGAVLLADVHPDGLAQV